MKTITKSNIIVFGLVGLIVVASWGMTVWSVFTIPMAAGAMVLASSLCTYSYVSFITSSLHKQKMNELYSERRSYGKQ